MVGYRHDSFEGLRADPTRELSAVDLEELVVIADRVREGGVHVEGRMFLPHVRAVLPRILIVLAAVDAYHPVTGHPERTRRCIFQDNLSVESRHD